MNKKNHRTFFIIAALVLIGMGMLVGIKGNNYWGLTVVTNAEKNSQSVNNLTGTTFPDINQSAKNYKANPNYETARELARKTFDAISILEIPDSDKNQMLDQVAAAHLNGSSNIAEANIVTVINNLAAAADAPDFAYVNAAQVTVTRKYLNRLMPDLVSASGGMSDVEAFTVFTGLLSQKIDNEDFMVPPGQFNFDVNNITGNDIPGRPRNNGQVQITQETPKTYQMIQAINNYAGSKRRLAATDIITAIGIQ
jgi:hypothetical protein